MLVMVVVFIALRWIHLSTRLSSLILLVLILLFMPTLNFLPVWFAFFFFQAEDGIRDRLTDGADPRAVHARALPPAARRRRGEVRQQRPLPAGRARRVAADVDGSARAFAVAARTSGLVHPHRARSVEPAPRQSAGPLHAALRDQGGPGTAEARGALAGSGAAPSRRSARRAAEPLADARAARRGADGVSRVPRPDGRRAEPPAGAGPPGLRRVDRRAGPDAPQPLLYDGPQVVPSARDDRA